MLCFSVSFRYKKYSLISRSLSLSFCLIYSAKPGLIFSSFRLTIKNPIPHAGSTAMNRRLTFQTSFVFVVLSYLAYRFPYRNLNSTPSVAAPENSTANNHIIRFLQYNKVHDLREYLERNVRSSGWIWVERRNPAARFPTDFALVAIEERRREFLIGEFGKLELVKDVHLDLSYQRGILNLDEEGGVDAFVDGKKRPGKIFTAMSFGEEDNAAPPNISGAMTSWRRNLMMQVGLFFSIY